MLRRALALTLGGLAWLAFSPAFPASAQSAASSPDEVSKYVEMDFDKSVYGGCAFPGLTLPENWSASCPEKAISRISSLKNSWSRPMRPLPVF